MRISWYFGFGWLSIVTVVACAVGINRLGGPIAWALYVPFLVVALYMTVRFRLYNSEPWRRVHGRAMIDYGELAEQEYDAAKKEGREFDIKVPCRRLGRGFARSRDERRGRGAAGRRQKARTTRIWSRRTRRSSSRASARIAAMPFCKACDATSMPVNSGRTS